MTHNMFQEGLYHVFFKETAHRSTRVTSAGELINGRIHRWFGTVVNTRLLVAGVRCLFSLLVTCPPAPTFFYTAFNQLAYYILPVSPQVVQILSAIACILTTLTHACVSYSCSVTMTMPVWSSLFVSPHLP